MLAYIVRRLLFIIPTLFAIMVVNFVIIQFVPGGPIERILAQIEGTDVGATARISGSGSDMSASSSSSAGGDGDNLYRGGQGLPDGFIEKLEKMYGLDKPPVERFVLMMGKYLSFDFGESAFRSQQVTDLIIEKMPVSVSLGLWTTIIVYIISIPLGIAKARRDGSRFDVWTSGIIILGYAIPGFLFAILLIVLFAGGSYWKFFPLRGLVSPGFDEMTTLQQITDYFWHLTLPLTALVIGSFATLTMLTKNSFLDQIRSQYITTARAKGLTEHQVLYRHVFRNGMLIIIAGFPGAIVGILFTGALLIEIIFSLDGLGLLGYEAAINRDYPVMFATLYIFTLLGLIMNLVGDLMYVVVDPRIDF
ncbi:MAG: microcin C ABC transporter permease YejB, partial [Rhodospirillaceae bacterium]|nr:microcin C ABC transporter permease YejB [Rhodospirillaceae bacterium]